MIEKENRIISIEGVRVMSNEILSLSGDLIEIDEVAIEERLIPKMTKYLEANNARGYLPEGHDLPIEQETGLNLFLDVINFCFKDPKTGCEYCFKDADGKNIKRATGLLTALSRSGVDWNDFEEVSQIESDRWREILQLSNENILYLGDERGDKITGFAKWLIEEGYSNMAEFVDGCRFSAALMTAKLSSSGFFDDPFMKRSQLACRMINDVLVRRRERTLLDIEKLTVMADYRIPQVFYNTGVVKIVGRGLSIKLQNEIPLRKNSREEDALRASAVCVGKMVADKMGVTEAEIDGVLWGLSQEMVKSGEMITPHMIVATDAY